MSIADAARLLDVNRGHIHVLAAQGRLVMTSRGNPASYVDQASVLALRREMLGGYEPEQVMTYTQAAATLRLSEGQTRSLVRTGRLTSVGSPRRKRVLRADVEDLQADLWGTPWRNLRSVVRSDPST